MTEADVIQPSASIASTGKGIRYIGKDRCYAYSGETTVNNIVTPLLSFTSGSGVIVGKFQFNILNTGGDDYEYQILFNDIVIQAYNVTETSDRAKPDYHLNLIIPPFTNVSATAQNITDTSGNTQILTMTGRVYGAE